MCVYYLYFVVFIFIAVESQPLNVFYIVPNFQRLKCNWTKTIVNLRIIFSVWKNNSLQSLTAWCEWHTWTLPNTEFPHLRFFAGLLLQLPSVVPVCGSFCLGFCLGWVKTYLIWFRWLTWALKNIPFIFLVKLLGCFDSMFLVICTGKQVQDKVQKRKA